jgi:hypothetical protein
MKAMATFVVCDKSSINTAIKVIVVLPGESKFEQNPLESLAKLRVEYAIDNGVESRV